VGTMENPRIAALVFRGGENVNLVTVQEQFSDSNLREAAATILAIG